MFKLYNSNIIRKRLEKRLRIIKSKNVQLNIIHINWHSTKTVGSIGPSKK